MNQPFLATVSIQLFSLPAGAFGPIRLQSLVLAAYAWKLLIVL
jgi:hypothetical protein